MHQTSTDRPDGPPPQKSRTGFRKPWRFIGVALLLAGVYWGHATVLTWCAVPLAPQETLPHIDGLWVRTEWGLARVAELYHAAPQRRILMVTPPWHRLSASGILPSYEQMVRTKLRGYGVPPDALTVLPRAETSDVAEAHALGQWLREHPGSQVLTLVDGFEGGAWQWTVQHTLDRELARRVAIESIDVLGCNAGNWWKSRLGAKTFCYGWLYYLHAWRYGHLPVSVVRWEPQAYEAWLKSLSREGLP